MNSGARNAILAVGVLCIVLLAWVLFRPSQAPGAQQSISGLIMQIKEGKVERVTINSVTGNITGKYLNGEDFRSIVSAPAYNDLMKMSMDHRVRLNVEKGSRWVDPLVPFMWLLRLVS